MPKAVYQEIYADLKRRIEDGKFAYGEFLPSENELTASYGCSRSSIRRALSQLASDGYIQSQQGKGVRVIRDPALDVTHGYDGLETFSEMARRLGFTPKTRCLLLERIVADEELSKKTGFPVGTELVRALRSRCANDLAVSTDDSYLPVHLASGLTPQIVEHGIYTHLEGELGVGIATSRRILTVERATKEDERYMDLEGFNAVAVMRSHTFDTEGTMIEFTESRQRPEFFSQYATVVRPH